MDELLKELVKNDLLSEETQKQLQEAITNKFNEAIETAKNETANSTKVELTEKWISERNALIEAIDAKIDEALVKEISTLKEDIEKFRDLEVEYAQKIIEHKEAMKEELKTDMVEILERLDSFLEDRIAVELQELKESIEEVKKLNFGRKIFEAFAEEFDTSFTDEDSIKAELNTLKDKLAVTEKSLTESMNNNKAIERKMKMEEILSTLGAHQREVMEAVLEKVSTDKLDEAFAQFLPRILKESDTTTEKETKVLAEGEKITDVKTTVKTGDKPLTEKKEELTKPGLTESAKTMLQRLGGIGQ